MNWHADVVFARRISTYGLEVTNRAAVSRAYYGAFNLCRRWLEVNATPIDNRSAHQQVWGTFETADLATAATRDRWMLIGRLGGALRQVRNQADYEDHIHELEARTLEAVGSAERIIRLLAELESVK